MPGVVGQAVLAASFPQHSPGGLSQQLHHARGSVQHARGCSWNCCVAAWLHSCMLSRHTTRILAYLPSLARMVLALCASNHSLDRSSGGRPCTAFCQDDGGYAAHLLLPLTTASLLLVGPTRGCHVRLAASPYNTVSAQRGWVGGCVRACRASVHLLHCYAPCCTMLVERKARVFHPD